MVTLIVFGGNSYENEISILTALKVKEEYEKNNWPFYLVYLDHKGNFYCGKALENKDNYESKIGFKKILFLKNKKGFLFKDGLKKHYFDVVLPIVHGENSEDGTVAAYFNTLRIPTIYTSLSNSSLLQDKYFFKNVLSSLKVKQTKYFEVTKGEFKENITNKINKVMIYPLIIKPAHLGSSIGVNKVENKTELIKKINLGFEYDSSLLIEEFVPNLMEINIAIFGYQNEIIVSELERVNNENKVLSFYEKYETDIPLERRRIIPADIDSETREKIISTSKYCFRKLHCFGIVRFDYLFNTVTKDLYLNEINTLPGSLAYYLFEPIGINFSMLLEKLIKIGQKKIREESLKDHSYDETMLNRLHLKIK